MDIGENHAGGVSRDPEEAKTWMNEVLLPIPRLWLAGISVGIFISLFAVTPTAEGFYTVSFRLTWVTVLLLALVWLPFLLKVVALSGAVFKGMGSEITILGFLDRLPSPEVKREVMSTMIPATKIAEETSTEPERRKLQKLREDLENRLAALSEMGTRYEETRRSMYAGADRTAKLETIMAEARARAKNTDINAEDARRIFDEGSEGNRVQAIALAQVKRNPDFFPLVIEAIRHPATPFELYHTLGAAYLMLPTLNEAQTQQLRDVVLDQRSGQIYYYSTKKLFPPDADIRRSFDSILDATKTEETTEVTGT